MTREEAKREMLFAKREVMADSWIDKAYDVAIKALEEPEPKWIPCEKRLPELWSEVLTTWIVNGEYKITRAELRPHGWFALVFPDDGRYKQDGCIAWMPLPEPYQGGE